MSICTGLRTQTCWNFWWAIKKMSLRHWSQNECRMTNVRAAKPGKKRKKKRRRGERERETCNTRWQMLETGVAMEKKWLLYTFRVQINKTLKFWKSEENIFQRNWMHEINLTLTPGPLLPNAAVDESETHVYSFQTNFQEGLLGFPRDIPQSFRRPLFLRSF